MMRRTAQLPTATSTLKNVCPPKPSSVEQTDVSEDTSSSQPSFSPPSISVRPVSGLISGVNHFPFRLSLARGESAPTPLMNASGPLNLSNHNVQVLPIVRPHRPLSQVDNRIQVFSQDFRQQNNINLASSFSNAHVSEINIAPVENPVHPFADESCDSKLDSESFPSDRESEIGRASCRERV